MALPRETEKVPSLRQIYILLFSLYWAQGLPVGFMTHALPVILRAQGYLWHILVALGC